MVYTIRPRGAEREAAQRLGDLFLDALCFRVGHG